MFRLGLLLTFFCLLLGEALAQTRKPKQSVIGGMQLKPIFPVAFLGTGAQEISDQGVDYAILLKSGFNFGTVIRKDFTSLLAVETGINYVKRKYEINVAEGSHSESSQFRMIGYEIPVCLLVYIQLGEFLLMNASMGVSPDVFASSVKSFGDNHQSVTVKRRTVQPALLANLGWEYRTEKSGYFYVGSSFHRPFNDVFVSKIVYTRGGLRSEVFDGLSGAYLTFEVRYYFPQ